MRATRITFFLAVTVLCAVSLAGSQTRADSLTRLADAHLGKSDASAARGLYEAALELNAHSRSARLGLGRALLLLEDWGGAKDEFNALLEADSSDTAAHYYAGIAYRETGTTKAWLLRNADWGTSRDHFFWVLQRDSSYEDVCYQYARLLEYRNEYPEAIAMGNRQIVKRPDIPGARIGLFRIYRAFVANDRPGAIAWLQHQTSSIAMYFLAEALRRDNRLNDAESILRNLLATNALPITQSLYLSLAKIAAKRGDTMYVEEIFWRAVDDIYTQLGADLVFEDLKYLVTDRELEVYRSLANPQKEVAFFHGFWNLRNPAAAGHSNLRIAEHYRRLVYAEDNYEYTGFRTAFTNPDRYHELRFPQSYALNKEFNDCGLIYIRHGTPDNVQRSTQGDDPNESWLYEETTDAPRRMFHFRKLRSAGNNWRLIPLPQDPDLLLTLVNWDAKFAELLRDNASAQAKAQDELVEESRTTVVRALATDEHTWTKNVHTFQFPFSIDAFRSSRTRSLLDVSYAIPLAQLSTGSSTPGEPLRSEIGLAIQDERGGTVISQLDTVVIPPGRNEKDTHVNFYRYLIPPGTYSIAMHVRPLDGNSFGSWKADKVIVKPTGQDLALSDIQYLLPSTIKSTLEIDGVKVVPSPFSAYANDRPLYVYLHVYNLIKDADGKTSYTVRYLLTPGRDQPWDPENPPEKTIVLGESTKVENEEDASIFGTLDLSRVTAGEYTLRVVVKDRKRVQTITGSRAVEVFEP